MPAVQFVITRFVDPAFPGFVECQLADAFGKTWTFIEKVPVITLENLDESSSYPRPCDIACAILRRYQDDAGRDIVRIDTYQPWLVQSIDEATQFDVLSEQLTEIEWSRV